MIKEEKIKMQKNYLEGVVNSDKNNILYEIDRLIKDAQDLKVYVKEGRFFDSYFLNGNIRGLQEKITAFKVNNAELKTINEILGGK